MHFDRLHFFHYWQRPYWCTRHPMCSKACFMVYLVIDCPINKVLAVLLYRQIARNNSLKLYQMLPGIVSVIDESVNLFKSLPVVFLDMLKYRIRQDQLGDSLLACCVTPVDLFMLINIYMS